VAIESQGLPVAGPIVKHRFPLLLDSKILMLNVHPKVVVLVAGGLDHWAYVAAKYSSALPVSGATSEIIRLLDLCMTKDNKAFGLVCGYNNSIPICYRINRNWNTQKTDNPIQEQLLDIQALGVYAVEAKQTALDAINNKVPPLVALVEAIEHLFPRDDIRGPVHSLVIRPGD
jgi:hypothetical protein